MKTITITKQTRNFRTSGKNGTIESEEFVWTCPCGDKDKARTLFDAENRAKHHSRVQHGATYRVFYRDDHVLAEVDF